MSNTFGTILRLTTFGESHGHCIGGVLDGMPAGVPINPDRISDALAHRRPASYFSTSRRENDKMTILSGIYEGKTLGTPIGFIINNADTRPGDYDNIKDVYRPSHADYTYDAKYGRRDHRGGGRASARETACRVVAGAIARCALSEMGIKVTAYTSAIGDVSLNDDYTSIDIDSRYKYTTRCPDEITDRLMQDELSKARDDRDTLGGIVTCVITGCTAGLGEPLYNKLSASLAGAMMSINAAKAFEIGMGMDGCRQRGSQMIDEFYSESDGSVSTRSNNSGGIQGGISNGSDICFRVGFKPVATLPRPVRTVDRDGVETILEVNGRHDICVVPRAVPVVEAMASLVILDAVLLNRASKW